MKYDPAMNVHDPKYGPGGKSTLYYDADRDEMFVRPERASEVAELLMRQARRVAEEMNAEVVGIELRVKDSEVAP